MVKYGGHVEAVREGDNRGTDLYLVPYNDIKSLIFQDAAKEPGAFSNAWTQALQAAQQDFTQTLQQNVWQFLFQKLAEQANQATTTMEDPTESPTSRVVDWTTVRGAHPGNALQMFVESVHPSIAQELLVRMTQIHRAAGTNTEGLRKLVKKYDKRFTDAPQSMALLPLLYTSSVYSGQAMLQDGIALLRELLEQEQESSMMDGSAVAYGGFSPLLRNDSEARHQQATEIRFEELNWLKRLVQSLQKPIDHPPMDTTTTTTTIAATSPSSFLSRLVAHRGFHHIKDRNDKRPIENSLSAYEMAWTAGIELCECDIALTKDDKLVLAHDENFLRLALDPHSPNSKKRVSDLTFGELISMPLRSGVRPPLLMDVLQSALAIASAAAASETGYRPMAQLVIEIKPGNEAAASALARLLIQDPPIRPAVAMIMSFDVVTMHRLRAELSQGINAGMTHAPSLSQFGSFTQRPRAPSLSQFTSSRNSSGNSKTMMHLSTSYHRKLNGLEHHHNNPLGGSNGAIGLSISAADLGVVGAADGLEGFGKEDNTTAPPAVVEPSLSGEENDMPKLMLLTVSDPPKKPCELQVSIEDTSPIETWLTPPEDFCTSSLDGVYMQFQPIMMTPKGAAGLRALRERGHLVGIWGYSGYDPDDYETFCWLVQQGQCSYVNTDLPNHFRKDVMVRTTSA